MEEFFIFFLKKRSEIRKKIQKLSLLEKPEELYTSMVPNLYQLPY